MNISVNRVRLATRGKKWKERKGEGFEKEEGKRSPGNPGTGISQIDQGMGESHPKLGLEYSVTFWSGGRRKGLRGAQEDPGSLREQWTPVRRAGSGRPCGRRQRTAGVRGPILLWVQAWRGQGQG